MKTGALHSPEGGGSLVRPVSQQNTWNQDQGRNWQGGERATDCAGKDNCQLP